MAVISKTVRHLSAAIATASLVVMGLLAACDDNNKGPDNGPSRSPDTSATTTAPKTVMTTSVATNGPVG